MEKKINDQKPEIALALLFFILALIGIANHELWVDEARPWLIAKSTSWSSLAYIAKLESHPVLWYAIVKAASAVYDNLFLMQLLSILFGFAAYVAILFYSPFSRIEKLLLTTNLYFFYEYTVIARNYSLQMAALFAVCALFAHRHKYMAAYLFCCGILAQSHFYGFLWSGVFVALLFIKSRPQPADYKKKSVIAASAFYLVCICATIWILVRESQQIVLTQSLEFISSANLLAYAKTFLLGLFPLMNPEEIYFNPAAKTGTFDSIAWLFLILWFSAFAYSIRKNRTALGVFLSMSAVLAVFSIVRQFEALPPRHLGQLMLIVLVSLWIGAESIKSKLLRLLVVLPLAVQAAAGFFMLAQDYSKPFSNGKSAAEWLQSQGLEKSEFIVDGPFYSAGFIAYLDEPFHDFYSGDEIYFWRLNKAELEKVKVQPVPRQLPIIHTRDEVILNRIKALTCEKRLPPIFVANYPAEFLRWPEVELQLLKAFTGSLRFKEDFYIYKVIADHARLCRSQAGA